MLCDRIADIQIALAQSICVDDVVIVGETLSDRPSAGASGELHAGPESTL